MTMATESQGRTLLAGELGHYGTKVAPMHYLIDLYFTQGKIST